MLTSQDNTMNTVNIIPARHRHDSVIIMRMNADVKTLTFLDKMRNLVSIHVGCVWISSQRGNVLSVLFMYMVFKLTGNWNSEWSRCLLCQEVSTLTVFSDIWTAHSEVTEGWLNHNWVFFKYNFATLCRYNLFVIIFLNMTKAVLII